MTFIFHRTPKLHDSLRLAVKSRLAYFCVTITKTSIPYYCTFAFLASQGAVPAGVELCGGDEMARSIHDSFERLKAGDESAAVFKKDVGELMIRPRSTSRNL